MKILSRGIFPYVVFSKKACIHYLLFRTLFYEFQLTNVWGSGSLKIKAPAVLMCCM